MSTQQRISEKVRSIIRELKRSRSYGTSDMVVVRCLHSDQLFNHVRIWVYGDGFISEAVLLYTPLDMLAIRTQFADLRETRFKTERFAVLMSFDSAIVVEHQKPPARRVYHCRYYRMEDTDVIRCISKGAEGVVRYIVFYPNNEAITVLKLTNHKEVRVRRMRGKAVEALKTLLGIRHRG